KDEFQSLGNDMNGLESARRAFGERMQKLAAAKEVELTRLRAQVKTLSAAPPLPPKKIVVDDTEPAKKPAAKKKVTKPKPPATTDAPPSASPPECFPHQVTTFRLLALGFCLLALSLAPRILLSRPLVIPHPEGGGIWGGL